MADQCVSASSMMDCLIHCSDDTSTLLAPTNLESWNALLRAATIRGYTPILNLAKDLPEGRMPDILYHRKCRSIFTMKKLLDSILAKQSSTVESQTKDRRKSFCTKRGEAESSLLPPCRDCLQLHIQRANYQTAVWRNCLEGQPDIPEPKGHGWTTDDKGMLL